MAGRSLGGLQGRFHVWAPYLRHAPVASGAGVRPSDDRSGGTLGAEAQDLMSGETHGCVSVLTCTLGRCPSRPRGTSFSPNVSDSNSKAHPGCLGVEVQRHVQGAPCGAVPTLAGWGSSAHTDSQARTRPAPHWACPAE